MNAALLRRNRWNDRFLKRPGRGNNTLSLNDALRGLNGKPWSPAVAHRAFDFNAGTHRQIEGPDVIFKVFRHIVFGNEAVGISPFKFHPRKTVMPRRTICHQRVPAPGSPGFGDAVFLDNQM